LRKKENSAGELVRPLAVARELLPELRQRESELDLRGKFAADNIDLLRQAGLLALTVPVSEGGMGGDLSASVETLRELAQASPSTALMLAMHNSTLAHYRLEPANVPPEERDFFLQQRAWAWGEAIRGCVFGVANSEPGAGGDVHNSKTQLSAEGDSVSGIKSFASMGLAPEYFMVAARDVRGGVDYYLVKNEAKTVRVESPWEATGMRSSESVTLRFDGAPVVAPLGYRGLLDGANNRHWSTLSFTAIFIGIAESLLEDAVSQAASMLQKTECVEFHLTLQASRAFLRHTVDAEPSRPDASYRTMVRDAKLYVTRSLALRAAALFGSQGGGAYRLTSPFSRKLRDLLAGPLLRPPVGSSFDEVWEELMSSCEL